MTARQSVLIGPSLVGIFCLGLAAASLVVGCAREPDVTLELVADDLVFRGDNPTLYVTTGAKVQLTLRNEADGVIHQLAIPELAVETRILQPYESQALQFRAPDLETTLTYTCQLHSLMAGKIVVASPEAQTAATPDPSRANP